MELPLNPFYLNALLANLNARRFVRNIEKKPLSFESSMAADLALRGLQTNSDWTPHKRVRKRYIFTTLSVQRFIRIMFRAIELL